MGTADPGSAFAAGDAYIRFNVEGFPGDWHVSVQRIIGEGHHAASWASFAGEDGTQPGPCLFELDEAGPIARITDVWPDPYELPAQVNGLFRPFQRLHPSRTGTGDG